MALLLTTCCWVPAAEHLLLAGRCRQPAADWQLLDPGFVAEAKARKWAQRWRTRWGARHGGIRVRDELPLEETRAKASPKSDTRGQEKVNQGVKNASPKWAHIVCPFWARLGGFYRESLCEAKMRAQNGPT